MSTPTEDLAVTLLRSGASDEVVERETGLSLEQILVLRAKAASAAPR